MTALGEGRGDIQGAGGLGGAALLVEEGDDTGHGLVEIP